MYRKRRSVESNKINFFQIRVLIFMNSTENDNKVTIDFYSERYEITSQARVTPSLGPQPRGRNELADGNPT